MLTVGVIRPGIHCPNGADYIADYLVTALRLLGYQTVEIGDRFGVRITSQHIELARKQDFLIHVSGHGLDIDLLRSLQRPLILWTHNDEIPSWESRIRVISRFVTIHYSYTKQHYYGDHVRHLPLAADHTVFYRDTDGGGYCEQNRKTDVAMIGCGHGWRVKFANELKRHFPNSVFDFTMQIPSNELNRIYNTTKVVICPYQDCDLYLPGSAWGCPCRTFEVPASGCLQLHVKREGLSELGFEIPTIETNRMHPEECALQWVIKISNLIDSVELRERLANASMQSVLERHLYTHRAQTMVNDYIALSNERAA